MRKIKHVVIIIQENRSFDNLFQGYPGADTVARGKDSKGRWIPLRPVSLTSQYVIDHSSDAMFGDCNGTGTRPGTHCRMNGFDTESVEGGPIRLAQYAYVPHDESKPYFDMAHEWVLSDRTFASQLDESFAAHQYLIAAQAHNSVNAPTALWGCGGGKQDLVLTIAHDRSYGAYQEPCFDYRTLGDELDAASLPWRFYTSEYASPSGGPAGYWSAYQAVRHIKHGPDWAKDVLTPQSAFITDVKRGTLERRHLDHAGMRQLRSHRLRWRLRPLVGRLARQRRRQERVLENDRDLRRVGRLGRLVRSRLPAVPGLRRPRFSRTVAGDLAVRETELRFARAVRDRRHPNVCRRRIWAGTTREQRCAREFAGWRLLRFYATAASVRADQRAKRPVVFPSPTQ